MTESITTNVTSRSAPATDDRRVRLRIGSATLLLGGLLFLLGVSRPVITDWANAWDDKTAQIAIARSDPGNFRFGMVTMGIGDAVMGIGAGLLLLAMARLFSGRRATISRSRPETTRCVSSSRTTVVGSPRAATSPCTTTARRSARAGSSTPSR